MFFFFNFYLYHINFLLHIKYQLFTMLKIKESDTHQKEIVDLHLLI